VITDHGKRHKAAAHANHAAFAKQETAAAHAATPGR
jgi:hypothetical protein